GASAWPTAPGPTTRASRSAATPSASTATTSRCRCRTRRPGGRGEVETMARRALLLGVALVALSAASSPTPAQKPKIISDPPRPKLEAVAETRLLMEGMAQPNLRGLDRLLSKEKPGGDEAWKFARGQALLLAETGNLLMLRPPRNL